jgi:hypothetical protein
MHILDQEFKFYYLMLESDLQKESCSCIDKDIQCSSLHHYHVCLFVFYETYQRLAGLPIPLECKAVYTA